jgi:hypothetical protein
MAKKDLSDDTAVLLGHRIRIASEKTKEGRRAVVGAHAGVNFQIPRDTECVVSEAVLEILRNAEVPDVELLEDGGVDIRMVQRFPITYIGPVYDGSADAMAPESGFAAP